MRRCVEPEWLDGLAQNDPRAFRSRRDLRFINAVMGNAAIVHNEINNGVCMESLKAIADIGAGDGAFMLRVAEARPAMRRAVQAYLVDRSPAVGHETLSRFDSIGWSVNTVESDVIDWLDQRLDCVLDVMIANLVLHHFDVDALARLFSLAASRTRLFVACEPARSGFALAGSRLLGLLGCNDVTRHDAVISVHAGFAGRELSALWPASGDWDLQEGGRGFFSHCFVARRLRP